MKDDLISRKAAIDRLNTIPPGNWYKARYTRELWNVPSVEAVPLDKLCEWLAERYEPPYAWIDIDKLKMPIDFRQQKEMWMLALTKWMEENK